MLQPKYAKQLDSNIKELIANGGSKEDVDKMASDYTALFSDEALKKKVGTTSTSTTPSQNLVSGKKVGSSGTAKQNNKAELDKLFARHSSKESEKDLEVSYNKVLKNKPLVNKPIKEVNREEIAVPTKKDRQITQESKVFEREQKMKEAANLIPEIKI